MLCFDSPSAHDACLFFIHYGGFLFLKILFNLWASKKHDPTKEEDLTRVCLLFIAKFILLPCFFSLCLTLSDLWIFYFAQQTEMSPTMEKD